MFTESGAMPLFSAIVLVTAIVLASRVWSKKKFNHPPGPPAIPFLGHSHLVNNMTQLEFSHWLSKQGPIVRLVLNGKNWIGINSIEISNQLLIKHGNIVSSRPFIPLVCDIIFRNSGVALMPYGDKWRKHKRLLHNSVNPNAVNQMQDILNEEIDIMLKDIETALEKSDYLDICEFVYDYAFSVILRLLFGQIPIAQDGCERPFHIFRKLAHDSFTLVTSRDFNFHKYLPFGSSYPKSQIKMATEMQQKLDRFIETYVDEVRKQIKLGTADDCVTRRYLKPSPDEEKIDFEEKEFISFLTNVLLAATETVGDNLAWALAALTKYPEHQVIAQKQIDSLDRPPTLKDSKSLYYTQNIIKESLRMFPSNVVNLPRENIEHFQYEGYDIPAGSTIMLNLYYLNRDPERYPDPEKFDPSGYGENIQSSELDSFAFGMGRRMCPGITLAKAEIFCGVANILRKYELKEDSKNPVVLESHGHSVSHPPVPFKVFIKKRQS